MHYLMVFLIGFLGLVTTASAQSQDGVFRDYAAYSEFVDQKIMQRDFSALILGLGGRDEFTDEQLVSTEQKMLKVWPRNFGEMTFFRQEDLGGGISQEGRIYWTGKSYAFYYAMLHQREDALVVISFLINSISKPIMERF
ncbi:MAG: hypothetical protein ACSHWS_09365 [Sulfitobacter sp.]